MIYVYACTCLSVPHGKYIVFPGEPQDFMAFPSLPPLVPAGTTGGSPLFSCRDAGLLLLLLAALTAQHSHRAAMGTLGDATASVEPGMGRRLWSPARRLAGMIAWLREGKGSEFAQARQPVPAICVYQAASSPSLRDLFPQPRSPLLAKFQKGGCGCHPLLLSINDLLSLGVIKPMRAQISGAFQASAFKGASNCFIRCFAAHSQHLALLSQTV